MGLSSPPNRGREREDEHGQHEVLVEAPRVGDEDPGDRSSAAPGPNRASIHETRTPCRRLDSGLSAAARAARPTRVRWKKAQSIRTIASETPMIPTSCAAMTTPSTSNVLLGNGLLERPLLALPDPRRRAVQQDEQLDRHGHDGDRLRARDRADHEPLDRDAAHERDHEREDERDPVRHAAVDEMPSQQMKVENIAISPWAKLRTPVER